jgi:hypothetical protein
MILYCGFLIGALFQTHSDLEVIKFSGDFTPITLAIFGCQNLRLLDPSQAARERHSTFDSLLGLYRKCQWMG